MKMQKKLNVLLIILVVALISVISFGGIYYKDKNNMISSIPDYQLDAELAGYRQVTINVAKEDNNIETETEDTEEETKNSEQENKDNTNEEKKTEEETPENYKKSADIIKSRLKSLSVKNYTVSLDENSGRVVITLPENDQTDIILSDIIEIGKFTIKDSNSNEILLSNEDVANVKFSLGQASSYSTGKTISMSINFNINGSKKFTKITQDYQNVVNETSSKEETNTSNNVENTESEESIDTNETTDSTSSEEAKKQVTINLDDSTLLTTDFDSVIDNGSLVLSFTAQSDEELSEKLYSAYNLGALIENDVLPLKYEIDGNTYVSSIVKENVLKGIIFAEIGLALAICLVMIIKYRLGGLLRTITSIGYIALLLLVLRFTNVTFSLEGIFALELGFIINIIFNFMMLNAIKQNKFTEKKKDKEFKELAIRYSVSLLPVLCASFLFVMWSWGAIASFGMVLFWSIIISWIYNILLNKLLVRN